MSLDAVLTSEIDAEQQLQDLLNRQPFVDQLISVTNILAENKKNACFALNGSWGIGKSFVLKMFEEQVSDIQTQLWENTCYFIMTVGNTTTMKSL